MINRKSKTVLVLLLSAVSFFALGQEKPRWVTDYDEAYPARTFLKGYSIGKVHQGETLETAKRRLLKDAQGLLAEDIRVTVRSNTSDHSVSTWINLNEHVESTFTVDVQTAAAAELAGIHSEPVYHDPKTGLLHAFVYVRRDDLADFYRKQINLDLSKAETAVAVLEQLVAAGKKMSARRKVEEARKSIMDVYSCADLLAAVSAGRDDTDMQISRAGEMMRTVEQLLINLENESTANTLSFVPFGVPQYYKNYKGAGTFFLITQSTAVVTVGLTKYLSNSYYNDYMNERVPSQRAEYKRLSENYQTMFYISLGVTGVLYI